MLFHLLAVGIYYYNTALCKIKVKSTKYSLPEDRLCYNGNEQHLLCKKVLFNQSAAPSSKRRHRSRKICGGDIPAFLKVQGCPEMEIRFLVRMFLVWRGGEISYARLAQGKCFYGVNELRKAGSTM